MKPPPVVGGERGEEDFMTQGVMSSGIISPRHGMMEYIGFVSIMLSRGKDLALGGFVGQVSNHFLFSCRGVQGGGGGIGLAYRDDTCTMYRSA